MKDDISEILLEFENDRIGFYEAVDLIYNLFVERDISAPTTQEIAVEADKTNNSYCFTLGAEWVLEQIFDEYKQEQIWEGDEEEEQED